MRKILRKFIEFFKVNGFIISNLSKNYQILAVDKDEFKRAFQGKGGLSDKAVWELSNKILEYIFKKPKENLL